MKLKGEILSIIAQIKYLDWNFKLIDKSNGFLLQAEWNGIDVKTGLNHQLRSRKWYIGKYFTTSEIVQTVFKCIITAQEHEIRENFLYKGERMLCPHFDVEELVKLCQEGSEDTRENNQPLEKEIIPAELL